MNGKNSMVVHPSTPGIRAQFILSAHRSSFDSAALSSGRTDSYVGLSIARRPVRQPVLPDPAAQPHSMHVQHALQPGARVARIEHVLRFVEARELPRRGVAVDLGDELPEALRIIFLLYAV